MYRKWGYFSSILANVWWFLRRKQTITENVIVPINYGPSFTEFSQTPMFELKRFFNALNDARAKLFVVFHCVTI